MIRLALVAALAAAALPVAAHNTQAATGPVAIEANQEVLAGFFPLGLADRLRDVCPDVRARHFRAWMAVMNLRSLARDQGYSDDDLRGLKHNLAAKDALKKKITEALRSRGAAKDDTASHCRVAREEIKADSEAGRLLEVTQ